LGDLVRWWLEVAFVPVAGVDCRSIAFTLFVLLFRSLPACSLVEWLLFDCSLNVIDAFRLVVTFAPVTVWLLDVRWLIPVIYYLLRFGCSFTVVVAVWITVTITGRLVTLPVRCCVCVRGLFGFPLRYVLWLRLPFGCCWLPGCCGWLRCYFAVACYVVVDVVGSVTTRLPR